MKPEKAPNPADLKVIEVPFSVTAKGVVSMLAVDAATAKVKLQDQIENKYFGFDTDNLIEEGILHDGSLVIEQAEADEPQLGEPVATEKPAEEHVDFEVMKQDFEEENADAD